MNWIEFFENNYEKVRVSDFESKYLPYLHLKKYLDQYFPEKKSLGKSFLGNDIHLLTLGNGKITVLLWSQMHGNESTGTRAMLDVFEILKLDSHFSHQILNELTIYFIPMLNPDGSTLYTRRNACGIDINRDFISSSSPEIRILKNAVNSLKPDYLFNLHDQRTIFNVGETREPATLSFLSPSYDESRTINETRTKAISIIDYMVQNLQTVIPGKLARFSDEFYPTSTGDNFTKLGFPTILVEAGHYPNDYERNETRRFFALAIVLGLAKSMENHAPEIGSYCELPENKKKFFDVLLRNVLVKSGDAESLLDIGIYFEEKLNLNEKIVEYWARIEDIGDLSRFYGHLEKDKNGKLFCGKSSMFPVIGELADFSVGSIHFDQGKFKG